MPSTRSSYPKTLNLTGYSFWGLLIRLPKQKKLSQHRVKSKQTRRNWSVFLEATDIDTNALEVDDAVTVQVDLMGIQL